MVILKYELKRHRKYILGWAIALALCVFVMTPTYYSFMDVSTGDLYETPRSARSEPLNICLQNPIPEKRFTGQRRSRFFSA